MRASVVCALMVAGAALAATWNSHENGFVWDDRAAVLGNRDVDASQSHWSQLFVHDFWGSAIDSVNSHKSYRPLTVLSFRWDRSLFGLDPHAFHRTNIAIHAICTVLVWRTAVVVLRKQLQPDGEKKWGALLAGLVFAVHPIHSDSVASIVGRADLLSVMFALSGFLVFDIADQKGSLLYFVAANVLAILACLCKELGFTIFGIFLAYDATSYVAYSDGLLSRRSVQSRRVWWQLSLAACILVGRVWVNGSQTKAVFNILANSINIEESRLTRLMSYAHVHAWYLWKLIWPSWLSYDYGFNTIPVISSVADTRNLMTATAYAVVLLGIAIGVRDVRHSPLLMCIAFGIIPFVPASNLLFPVGTVLAERVLYFPSVGFCLIIGCVTDTFANSCCRYQEFVLRSTPNSTSSHSRSISSSGAWRASVVMTACILVVCVHKSSVRNAEWMNEETLFAAAVEVVPDNVKALNNAAKTLLSKDPGRAYELARAGVALLPNHVEGHSNLGLALADKSDKLVAIRHMIKAFANASTESSGAGYSGTHIYDYWSAQHNDTTTVFELTRSSAVSLAKTFLDKAIRRGTQWPLNYHYRGRIAEALGDLPKALWYIEAAKHLNDRIATSSVDEDMALEGYMLHNHVAILRRQNGDEDKALTELLEGLDLYPTEPAMYFNVASIYISRGMLDWASTFLERCLHVCEGASTIHSGAALLERLGQKEAAQAFYAKAALASDP